jgi:hypothetical protein
VATDHAHESASDGQHDAGARVERGVRVSGADPCYLCDTIIRDGDRIVFYLDEAFWGQGILYHRACWNDAEMAAKLYGGEERCGGAIVLSELECADCGEMIAIGDAMVRVRPATRAVDDRRTAPPPRVFHAECLPENPA